MRDIVVVRLLSNRHWCAELTFHYYFKNLGENKIYNKGKSEKIRKADSAPLNRSENIASCQNC